jgi:predicted MFS family arabinose efflux permease
LPALITLWIRRAVAEPETWATARHRQAPPGVSALFGPAVRVTTWRVLAICAVSLTAHWAFMFWQQSHIRFHPAVRELSVSEKNNAAVVALTLIMAGSICGNYLAGWFAKLWGYRRAVVVMMAAYCLAMLGAFVQPWSYGLTLAWFTAIGLCQGVFGLFTMCLPPLFPTLLRTTGAGFCYNIGRIVAAGGTVFFGLFGKVGDYRDALFYAGFLFAPAAFIGLLLPEREDDAD